MTRILLDTQIFDNQEFGGISRYFIELFTEILKNKNLTLQFPLLYTNNLYFKESVFFQTSFQNKNAFLIKNSKIFRPFLPRKLKRKSIQQISDLLENQGFDLFIPTYYDPYFLDHLRDKPFVLTVHDMIHELYPHYFTNEPETIHNKKLLIERSTKIIAISENTKKDLLHFYPHIDPGKIEVVYLAHTANPVIIKDVNLPEKYILFVGKRSVYKNFDFFLKAVRPVIQQHPDLYIFCAGGDPFTSGELSLIKSSGLGGRLIQKNFEDKELAGFYKNALCFVFPSEYEGFGIPILEAMSAGCPVILTNNSSFPEVAGDAGIYFETNNAADLEKKLGELLVDSELRELHIDKGIKQAAKFNWKKTAQETMKVYELALKLSHNG
jgi:glycosyltransferase involved in cell wall biosynthesis